MGHNNKGVLGSLRGRLLRGDPAKRSRFRDFEGRAPAFGAWLYFLPSVASTLRYRLTGTRAAIPWLGYRGVRRIRQLVGPRTRVLEFGSGLSTVWFAHRGAEVVSVESNDLWLSRVEGWLAELPAHRVRLIHAQPPYDANLLAPEEFDFALVDGDSRDSAMRVALSRVRPGGFVYLDNADVAEPAHRAARDLALTCGKAEWFVDFTPFQVFVSTGLLVQRSSSP